MEYFFGIVIFGSIFLIAWVIGNIREAYKRVINRVINIEGKVTNIEAILKELNDSDNHKE